MPLFDPLNPKSEEAAVYYRLKTLIGGIAEFAELVDVAQADAPSRIVIGPTEDPWDSEQYTIAELEEGFGWAQLRPADEESFAVFQSKGTETPPNKSGNIVWHTRRQIRESEFTDAGGRQDAYLFFMDRTNSVAEQLMTLLKSEWWYERMQRTAGPHFNPHTAWASQGVFLWCDFMIEWATESQQ